MAEAEKTYEERQAELDMSVKCSNAARTLALEGYEYAYVDNTFYIQSKVDLGSLKYALSDDGVEFTMGKDNKSIIVGDGRILWGDTHGNESVVTVGTL